MACQYLCLDDPFWSKPLRDCISVHLPQIPTSGRS